MNDDENPEDSDESDRGTDQTGGRKRKNYHTSNPGGLHGVAENEDLSESDVEARGSSSIIPGTHLGDEDRKLAEKRAYNRRNAARARQRVKDQLADLSERVVFYRNESAQLKAANERLASVVKSLMAENDKLKQYITTLPSSSAASASQGGAVARTDTFHAGGNTEASSGASWLLNALSHQQAANGIAPNAFTTADQTGALLSLLQQPQQQQLPIGGHSSSSGSANPFSALAPAALLHSLSSSGTSKVAQISSPVGGVGSLLMNAMLGVGANPSLSPVPQQASSAGADSALLSQLLMAANGVVGTSATSNQSSGTQADIESTFHKKPQETEAPKPGSDSQALNKVASQLLNAIGSGNSAATAQLSSLLASTANLVAPTLASGEGVKPGVQITGNSAQESDIERQQRAYLLSLLGNHGGIQNK